VKLITKLSMPSAYKLLELLETNQLIKEVTGGQRGRMYSFEKYLKIFKD
jgi:Fe2+ or Zn2+ uptake regulation protein